MYKIYQNITLLLVGLLAFICSCTEQKAIGMNSPEATMWGNDPQYAEQIYQPSLKTSSNEFKKIDCKNTDGSITRNFSHATFANTEFYCLYSPVGNLRLIAAGASEMGDIYGYLISYNTKGQVDSISLLKPLSDIVKDGMSKLTPSAAHDLFKQWILDKRSIQHSYYVKKDSIGNVLSIASNPQLIWTRAISVESSLCSHA